MNRQSKMAFTFVILFLLPFLGIGLFTFYKAFQLGISHGDPKQFMACLAGGSVFTLVGGGLLFLVLRGIPKIREGDQLRKQYPDEPWRWKHEWNERKIPSTSGGQAVFYVVFAFIWNAISWPAALLVLPEFQKGKHLAVLGFLFPLIGIGLFWLAARETWAWLKFGTSYFLPDTMPGVIGGSLKGVIQTHRRFPEESRFQVRLLCINRKQSGEDTFEKTLWQEESRDVYQQASYDSGSSAIPMHFQIPRDNRDTDSVSRDQILWRLEVTCDVPGLDYKAQFEVPVFVTADSKDTPVAASASAPSAFDWMTAADVKVQSTLNGKEFYFPPGRHRGALSVMFLFVAIFGGATALWFHVGMYFPGVICGLVTALVGLILLFMVFGYARVNVAGGKLVVQKGMLGFTTSLREYPASDIQAIQLKVGMQVGEKLYYDLEVARKFASKRSIGGSILNKREAEAIAAEISRLLKLT